MPCITPFQSSPRSFGHIAVMRYRHGLGHCIYGGEAPHKAEFVQHPDHARRYRTRDEAAAAGMSLVRAFEIKNRDAVELFTLTMP